ncbi:MAG: LysE family translocator [Motiliproteus sp.]
MPLDTWLLFCSASLLVILIPGPLSLLMITNSLNHGIIKSTPAFIGGTSASVILLTASATGLGALLLASESLFTAIRYAGALYLIYLGYRTWQDARQCGDNIAESATTATPRFSAMFWRAFSLGISNPKDILFFVAFLPQFIDPQGSMATQLLVMTASWCVLDLTSKLLYGSSAKVMAPALRKARNLQRFNRISAGLFVSAGTAVLFKSA